MNILVITPLYYIEGRSDLIHDSSAIHYLIKPWVSNNNVLVIYLYLNSIKQVYRYLNSDMRRMKNGYFYDAENVRVALIEIQKLPKQGPIILEYQSNRVADFIKKYTRESKFYPDVVLSHIPTTSASVVNQIFPNVTKIAVLHNTDKLYWKKRKRNSQMIKQCYDLFYTRSKALYQFFLLQDLPNLRDDIIYSGISDELKAKRTIISEKINIAFVGKLIPLKNVDVTIKAIAKLHNKDLFFHVVGEGAKRKSLEKLAKNNLMEGSYRFYGHLDRTSVIEMLANMDIFVMVSSPETFGLSYLEAMKNGCIPIGGKGEGIDGVIVDGENGFLVKPKDVDQLAEVIKLIIEMDQIRRDQIIDNAIMTASKFNEYDMSMNYYRLIADACKH